MKPHNTTLLIFLLLLLCSSAMAHERFIIPQWYEGKSDFREAYIDKDGYLVDSYTLMNSDTVNVIDTKAQGDYGLEIVLDITNLHDASQTSYPQYYYDDNGVKRRGKSVKYPVYGWVIGMKDMQHYSAVLMRPCEKDDILYESPDIEYSIVTINGNDTTIHTDWKVCRFNNYINKYSQYKLWIQYNNNTLWLGGGWNDEIPWEIVYNVPSYGSYTGLYLTAGSKIRVKDVYMIVKEKNRLPRTSWNTQKLQQYFKNTKGEIIEDFWEIHINDSYSKWIKDNNGLVRMGGDYKMAIVANEELDCYDLLYLEGAKIYPGRWNEGDIKARLYPTISNRYDVEWYDAEGDKVDNIIATLQGEVLKIDFIDDEYVITLRRYTQISPKSNNKNFTGSGTGFAITTDGYLVTNHHVIDNATTITASQTSNNQIVKKYNAVVVASDPINDLAIIRIDDPSFKPFEELPYCIDNRIARKGETVFYLGYPKTNLLNKEIKVSNGTINAINGLLPSHYMVSIDIDNGSSGSPMFDNDGNVLGVMSLRINENLTVITANYAVKALYLTALIEQVKEVKLTNKNKIKGLSYPDKIETIAPYVFLLNVEGREE